MIDPEAKNRLITETWNYNDASYAEFGPKLFSNVSRWDDGIHCGWLNQMWYEENKWKSIMMNNMEGTIYNATTMTLLEKDDNTMMLETAITDTWRQLWPVAVQAASEADLDAAWEALQRGLEGAGIREYEEILSANYINNEQRLGN